MAQEWYLMKSPYDQVSGFESEALEDFSSELFLEVLDTEVATDVELYNYDLSECQNIRAIIQNNLQDTKLKTLVRQALVPIGTCHAGMYIKYKGRFWLITGLVDDDKMYEKAVLSICNWKLSWLDENGNIVQRWANITSASQYNNGETHEKFYTIRTDQLMILVPDDDTSITIKEGTRFIIDKRCDIYEKRMRSAIMTDFSNPVLTYRIARRDSVLWSYNTDGIFEFMVVQDEQHEHDGCYTINGEKYWLCEQPEKEPEENTPSIYKAEIMRDEDVIYNGFEPSIFIASFTDSIGRPANITPTWRIESDFYDKLNVIIIDNYISISVNDQKLINKSFKLFLGADGYESTSIDVYIRAIF